jgi:hypothetical protein
VSAQALYVVHVTDRVHPQLSGRRPADYASPPQPHADALELVALLLGAHQRPAGSATHWTRPIAGGKRTITLAPAQHVG